MKSTPDPPRFAYEEAERVLDEFAEKRSPEFKRSWMKFKFILLAWAYGDYSKPGHRPTELQLSYAWEDMQMALVGHGETTLSGAVLQLWGDLKEEAENEAFDAAIREAFQQAEARTPKEATRRYLRSYRTKKPRRPEEGFTLPTILPMNGVRLREWAVGTGNDPDVVEEQWYWLELADRDTVPGGISDPPPSQGRGKVGGKRPRLRLVKDNT